MNKTFVFLLLTILFATCSGNWLWGSKTETTETIADPSTGEVITNFDDNIPFDQKVGLAQTRKHFGTRCERKSHGNQNPTPRSEGDYDFIIVGGGSAGNVVAARLADADPSTTVLLIESGENPVDNAEQMSTLMKDIFKMEYCVPGQTAEKCSAFSLPLHFSETPFTSLYPSLTNASYYYTTTPQLYANKREIQYPRGNLLGGSSATNNLVAFRGHPSDFDHWASLGLPGWSYSDLLPFMKLIETNHDYTNTSVHGNLGPIHLINSSKFFNFPVVDALIDTAVNKMGYPKVEDFNKGYDHYGAGYWQQYSNDKGRRTSSFEYIRRLIRAKRVCLDGTIPNFETDFNKQKLKVPQNGLKSDNHKELCTSQQNLHIITTAFVTRIIFDNETSTNTNLNSTNNQTQTPTNRFPRAIGVEYVNHTETPYKAVRHFPAGSPSNEGAKSRMTLSNWDKSSRAEILNCPVDDTLSWNPLRKSEWYIPPLSSNPLTNLRSIYAKKEIILTAGTINSAQLLLLSGIGPQQHLENEIGFKNNEIIIDLPGVGTGVADHEELTVNFKLPDAAQHWGILKDFLSETAKWVDGNDSSLSSNHIPGGMDISSQGINGTTPTIHIHFAMMYLENLDQTLGEI